MIYLYVFLVIWTIVSVWYVLANLGNKSAPTGIRKYVEYILAPPALIIAAIIGITFKVLGK